jgi:hypothetical protein
MILSGSVAATYVRGRRVYDRGRADGSDGIVAESGYGRFLTWGYS